MMNDSAIGQSEQSAAVEATAGARDAQTMRKGVVAVKPEFLRPVYRKREEVSAQTNTSPSDSVGVKRKADDITEDTSVSVAKEAAAEEEKQSEATGVSDNKNASRQKSGQRQKQKVTLKQRHQSTHPTAKEDRVCSFIMRGEACPYTGSCTYSHDLLEFLSRKPKDIDSECYNYKTFGYCHSGVACRFGEQHIDKATGANLRRSEADGGVVDREQINVLQKDVQALLRKKKYIQMLREEHAASRPDLQEGAMADTSVSEMPSSRSIAKEHFNMYSYPEKCMKLVDFSRKVYVAPLTTIGNLPFRRILKEYGADITCGEMAMAHNLMAGQASEWALLRKHGSENCFGIQLAGNSAELMANTARLLERETVSHFVDLNCGCPIDVVCSRGSGSSLMTKHNKLCSIVEVMAKYMPSRSITVKIRTGWNDNDPTTHRLLPLLQKKPYSHRVAALMVHGRSRLQRYQRLADWSYILRIAQSQDPTLRRIPVIGNGDILTYTDWRSHQQLLEENITSIGQSQTKRSSASVITSEFVEKQVDLEHADGDSELLGLCSCAMLGRGALIKPWLPQEIKEERNIDIPATERLEILKKFCNYGLEHWGSDNQGVSNTRRFLLEWMSFLHRYVPLGLTEYPQRMNERPPAYFGRDDLETMLSSPHSADWIKISEMFLGPVSESFSFIPKHKSNAYTTESQDTVNLTSKSNTVSEWG